MTISELVFVVFKVCVCVRVLLREGSCIPWDHGKEKSSLFDPPGALYSPEPVQRFQFLTTDKQVHTVCH